MTEEVHYWKVIRDGDGGILTWSLVDANPPALTTWGKSLEEIRGRSADEIFGPGATDHYLPLVEKFMPEGVPYSFEDYFPNLNKYFRFTGIPMGEHFFTTGADITEVKLAEEKLRRENREMALANRILRVFIQNKGEDMYDNALAVIMEGMRSSHGVFGYMDERGHLICPSLTRMLDQCEVQGKCIHYPPEKWKGLWARALLEKRTFYSNTPSLVPPGHPPIANNLAVPILFQGKAIGLINLANKEEGYTEEDRKLIDTIVSRIAPVLFASIQKELREEERRRAEAALAEYRDHLERLVEERTAELQLAHDQLLHAEKLSAVGKLSASIAHEFNNPLFGIRNVVAGIRRRIALEEEDAELVDLALKECDRIKYLIQSLQDFYRPTSGEPSVIDLHRIIDNLLLLVNSEFRKRKIDLTKDYAPQLPNIVGVPDQIKQVLLNLLKNAGEAIPAGGGKVAITTENRGDRVAIQIRDSGAGIRPEDREHIFEPFFTTKPEVKGTGLGLSVSHGIIATHGGRIEVESEPGRGSIFTIILPVGGVGTDENQNHPVG
jgi:signal transduction histidine kinase